MSCCSRASEQKKAMPPIRLFCVVAMFFSVSCMVRGSEVLPPPVLSVSIWSDSAIELFWERVQSVESVVGYEVQRDGLSLGVLDALSLFEEGLQPDTTYHYSVRTVGVNHVTSSPAEISVRTASISTGPSIGESDYVSVPSGVKAIIYSNTAAEVFWDRNATLDRTYEVSIDSAPPEVITGTSFYIDSLLPGHAYRVTVAAVESGDRRSSTVPITLDTFGSSFPRAVGGDEGAPSAPSSARLIVYSDTAAELFWDRPAFGEYVIGTEVVRNGEMLEVAPGNSFFDPNREPGTAYRYELTAINQAGQRSATTPISPQSQLPSDPTSIWLAGIREVTTDHAHAQWYPIMLEYYQPQVQAGYPLPAPPSGLTLETSEEISRNSRSPVIQLNFSCVGGGTHTYYGYPDRFGRGEMVFERCQLLDRQIDGSLQITGWDVGGYDAEYDSLSIRQGSGEYWIDGLAQRRVGRGSNFIIDTIGPIDYTVMEPELQLSVNGLLQKAQDSLISTPRTTFETSFNVVAPWSASRQIEIVTRQPFSNADAGDGVYATGRLQVLVSGGVSLLLDADTGERSTFQTYLTRDGAITSATGVWGEIIGLPCVSITGGDQPVIAGCEIDW